MFFFLFAHQLDGNTAATVRVSHLRVRDLHVLFVDPFQICQIYSCESAIEICALCGTIIQEAKEGKSERGSQLFCPCVIFTQTV